MLELTSTIVKSSDHSRRKGFSIFMASVLKYQILLHSVERQHIFSKALWILCLYYAHEILIRWVSLFLFKKNTVKYSFESKKVRDTFLELNIEWSILSGFNFAFGTNWVPSRTRFTLHMELGIQGQREFVSILFFFF